jgi:membrane protein
MLVATLRSLVSDRGSMAAAGCAFYATFALLPAITMLVSIYGLVFSRADIAAQLHYLHGLLPAPGFVLITNRVHTIVAERPTQLGIHLIVSSIIVFWSSATGTKSLLSALNVVYGVVEEPRGFLRYQAVTLGMTLAAMIVGALAIAILVFIPIAINSVGLTSHAAALTHALAMVLLVTFVAAAIAVLYRIGPSPTPRAGQRILVGTVAATALWLIASALLNMYIKMLPAFGATYGPIAAVMGVMLWFYVSAYAILFGAELNAELESSS